MLDTTLDPAFRLHINILSEKWDNCNASSHFSAKDVYMNQNAWRAILFMMITAVILNLSYSYLQNTANPIAEISYSRFRNELAGDNLKNVRFKGVSANGEFLKNIRLTATVQGKEVWHRRKGQRYL